jgi:hypothetical protein
LLQDLLQEGGFAVALVDTERLVLQQDDHSLELNGMPDRQDLTGAWWWVKGAFVMLAYPLEEGAVVAAYADREADLVVVVCLKAIETCLDCIDAGIDSKVVLENEVDSIGRHSATLSHQDSLAILVKADIRQAICMEMQHVQLLEFVKRPDSDCGVKGSANEQVRLSPCWHEAAHLLKMASKRMNLLL